MNETATDRLNSLFDRPDLKPRALAIVIDLSISFTMLFSGTVLGFVYGGTKAISGFGFLGTVACALFFLLKDGIYMSSSPGKKLARLTVTGIHGNFINILESANRNFVMSLPFWFYALYQVSPLMVPFVGDSPGWAGIVGIPLSLALCVYELISLLLDRSQSPRRWGDQIAATVVVPTS